ncbi:MAG: diguanylate cyclase [Paracoccaceae bacterium]|nr:diguanylate cyclase [Paracoccaceae bacterium]
MEGRILIADDLATNRILLKAKLASTRYEVLLAPSRAEAAALAAATRPDLVIVDLGAPAEAALALVQTLKAQPATAEIALIALTPRPDAALRRAALEAGADDALARSADEAPLLARIRGLMRARNREAELGLREETCAELGFAEAAPAFEGPGVIALVAARPETAVAWRTAIAPRLRDHVEVIHADRLLDDPRAGAAAPDVYVIAADLAGQHDGLRLIAELRSRARGRAAGVVAVTAPGDGAGEVAALDHGADDVIEEPVDPVEMVLRLRAQLRRKARTDRLRRQLSDGLRLAMTDPLTGLSNRRSALVRLARIAERAARTGQPFAVMVLDLDRFKRVNDGWGHGAGDAVLVEAARRLAGALRAEDLVARLGGEEFLVVMPDTTEADAGRAAERLRRAIEAEAFPLPDGDRALELTVSIGVALAGAPADTSVEALVGIADRALYTAKADGRNQVTFVCTVA